MNDYLAPESYLPHKSPMLLLEKVIAVHDEKAHCQVMVSSEGVLAPFLDEQGNLPGWYALELMAQTIGVWSGWHHKRMGEKVISFGLVLGARELICHEEGFFPNNALLDIHVDLLMQDQNFGSFTCTIHQAETCLATGRVNTYQPQDEELQTLFN